VLQLRKAEPLVKPGSRPFAHHAERPHRPVIQGKPDSPHVVIRSAGRPCSVYCLAVRIWPRISPSGETVVCTFT
jgi:hypothetical protein